MCFLLLKSNALKGTDIDQLCLILNTQTYLTHASSEERAFLPDNVMQHIYSFIQSEFPGQ